MTSLTMIRKTALFAIFLMLFPLCSAAQSKQVSEVKKLETIGYKDGRFAGLRLEKRGSDYYINIFGVSRKRQISNATVARLNVNDVKYEIPVETKYKSYDDTVLEDVYIPITRRMLFVFAGADYIYVMLNDNYFDLTDALKANGGNS